MYPLTRLRRNRKSQWLRELIAETKLLPQDFVLPIFVTEGENKIEKIKNLPGVFRYSIDKIVSIALEAQDLGIKAIALFPHISADLKDEEGSEAYNLDNLICRAIRTLRAANINIGIICDVALDPYTTHGHDGIIKDNKIDNESTLEALTNQSRTLAKAGVDIIAPSDMMDGRILKIRQDLDAEGFSEINIISYAAKYASSFYSPFRSAIESAPDKADSSYLSKSTYQMDVRNIKEAMIEIEHDIDEGADIVMIKPAMTSQDVIYAASERFNVNIFSYQVSGEYAMMRYAADAGALDWEDALIESLIALKRAGSSAIFTYGAIEASKIILEKLYKK